MKVIMKTVGLILGLCFMGTIAYFLFVPEDTPRRRDNSKIRAMLQDRTYLLHIKDGSYFGNSGFAYKERAIVEVFIKEHRIEKIEIISERTTMKPEDAGDIIEKVVQSQSVEIDLPPRNAKNPYPRAIHKSILHAIQHAHYDNLERQWFPIPKLPRTGV